MTEVFLGTALALADYLEENRMGLVTIRGILLEIGNALAKLRYRAAAVALLDALENDVSVEIVSLSDELYGQALQLYRERPDKEWGLIDCLSCIVMRNKRISEALTTDEHFRQMGFRVLMWELPIGINN